mgnify:CR=1 FL=1
MQVIDKKFYHDLKKLAAQDLSQAHLLQHFTSANLHLKNSGLSLSGNGTWSSQKSFDTAEYCQGTLNGKKHWISGISLCEWAVIPVKHNNTVSVVLFETKNIKAEPVPTMGMENTLTVHVVFDQTPATFLYDRQDPKCFTFNNFHNLCFLTNHLGLMESLLNDIDLYTGSKFDYEKKKLRTDIEVMNLLWNNEVNMFDQFGSDQFKTRDLIYAFAKKTLTNVTNFVTEVTGSSLYDARMPAHQRYKDALIYSTHMRNVSNAVDIIFDKKL